MGAYRFGMKKKSSKIPILLFCSGKSQSIEYKLDSLWYNWSSTVLFRVEDAAYELIALEEVGSGSASSGVLDRRKSKIHIIHCAASQDSRASFRII